MAIFDALRYTGLPSRPCRSCSDHDIASPASLVLCLACCLYAHDSPPGPTPGQRQSLERWHWNIVRQTTLVGDLVGRDLLL